MPSGAIKHLRKLDFRWETKDPFVFCVHHKDNFPKGNAYCAPDASLLEGRKLGDDFTLKDGWRMYRGDKVPGFPCHPHRGFETITISETGFIDHADTNGGAGRYGNGDIHWLTAGSGIMHSEMFPLINENKDNPLELFQVWLNSPSSKKDLEPSFDMIWSESVPIVKKKDKHGRQTSIKIYSGQLGKVQGPTPPKDSWAANPDHHVAIWQISMDNKASWTLPAAAPGLNRTLYFYEGDGINVDGIDITLSLGIDLFSDCDVIIHNENSPTKILMLQGRPISEPIVHYGPFVMNTQDEILETFRTYQRTQFGKWPWSRYDMVHNQDKDRFAKFADGSVIKPK